MGGFELTLGPMYLGTIINVWLYGIIVTQATVYFGSFSRDAKWIKIMVTWLLILETINSAFNIGLVWRFTIHLFGDLEGLTHSHWLLNIEPFMTVVISSTAQCFFAWRIAKLTGRVWLGCLIASTSMSQFGAGLSGTIGAFRVKEFARFHELSVSVIIWLVSTVVTDSMITCVLTWYLHTHRTGYSRTDNMINRLVRSTMQTGLMFTIWATTDLVLFLVMLYNNMHILPQLPMCKLYTASLLSTLNARKDIREFSITEDTSDITMAWRRGSVSNHQSHPSLAVSRQLEGFKPNVSLERPEPAVHTLTTTLSHRGSNYEMRVYKDKRGVNADDIEAYMNPSTFSHAAVKWPGATSSGVVSDEASTHPRTSNDGK